MASDILFQNFSMLVDAPNSVQKMRELILQLAVQGKLVPHDKNDEPASELLKRIIAENERLIKLKKIKKSKPLLPVDSNEMPFELPPGWIWVNMETVCFQITDGTHFTPNYTEKGIHFLSVKDISSGKFNLNNTRFISPDEHKNLIKRCKPEFEDVLLTKVGTTGIAKVIDVKIPFSIFVSLALLKFPKKFLSPYFLELLINSPLVRNQSAMYTQGVGNKNLVLKHIKGFYLPLPPFKEQKRIVEKVDQMMALCDELEARQQKAIDKRTQLNDSAIDNLLAAEDADEFADYWQLICKNFDLLYDNPESVDRLRQAILQLAIQGKLVAQDKNDEPAKILLEKIAEEKSRLIKEGIIKNKKPLPEIGEDEKPFKIPVGWEWARLQNFTSVGTGSTPSRNKPNYYSPPEINWVTSGETSNEFITGTKEKISPLALKETNVTVYPVGTLIIAMYGQGKTRGQVSELMIEAGTNQACAAVVLINNDIAHRKYVKIFFKKAYEELRGQAAGGAQPNLNVGKVSKTVIPLPPLAEQKRIVEKVDQLMALCDSLQVRLNKSKENSDRLLDAVLYETLAA